VLPQRETERCESQRAVVEVSSEREMQKRATPTV
jgi:hypothetical protein